MSLKTIIVMDTEAMGLANYQADSAEGFGVYQISALKFTLSDDGKLHFVDHFDAMVEPDASITFPDPREGAKPRKRFFDDYAGTATFRAYQQIFNDPDVGFNTHYYYYPRNPNLPDQQARIRSYLDHVKTPEEADAMRSQMKRYIIGELSKQAKKNGARGAPKKITLLATDYLQRQIEHYEKLGNESKVSELGDLKSAMLVELAAEPWLLEQIDESHQAAKAMGLYNRELLVAKATKVNKGAPLNYAQAAKAFSAFSKGASAMVAHNAMFDYSIMLKLYAFADMPFPFTLEQVVDTLAMAAIEPHRLGHKNNLNIIIEQENITKHDVINMDGVGEATLAKCLSSPTIRRLNKDKTAREAVEHDALEDVFITAAFLERCTTRRAKAGEPLLPNIGECVKIGTGSTKGVVLLADKAGTNSDILHIAAFIPVATESTPEHCPTRLTRDFIQSLCNIEPSEPSPMIAETSDGTIVNLQKVVPMLGSINAIVQLSRPAVREAIQAASIDFSEQYGRVNRSGFSKLVVIPDHNGERRVERNESDSRYLFSPFEYLASAPYLRWGNPYSLREDLNILSKLYQFITPFGGKAHLEDGHWLSVSAPIAGMQKTVDQASQNMRRLYRCCLDAVRNYTLVPEGKTEEDIVQGGIGHVDQRPFMRIDYSVFLKIYERDETKLGELILASEA